MSSTFRELDLAVRELAIELYPHGAGALSRAVRDTILQLQAVIDAPCATPR